MATRPPSGWKHCLLGLLCTVALLRLLYSQGASIIDESCATTPYPDRCKTALLACPDGKDAATPRALAEAAIRAAANAGAAAGSYARGQLDVVKDDDDDDMSQCLDECADDIEEAVSHLDDSEGEIDDDKFNEIKLFLDTAERDAWSCDESCRDAPQTPVKAALLAKTKDFETIMTVTNALIKQATGAAPAPAP